MNAQTITVNRERNANVLNGWVMLPFVLLLLFGGIALFILFLVAGVSSVGHLWGLFYREPAVEPLSIILLVGFFYAAAE